MNVNVPAVFFRLQLDLVDAAADLVKDLGRAELIPACANVVDAIAGDGRPTRHGQSEHLREFHVVAHSLDPVAALAGSGVGAEGANALAATVLYVENV